MLLLSLAFLRTATAEPTARDLARAMSDAMADLADEVAPTTVYIQSDKGMGLASGLEQLMRDYQLPQLDTPGPTVATSSGSGVIIGADGLVLTNHHVVSGASGLVITLQDQRRLPGRVLGSDPRTDVALVQVLGELDPLPVARIGDSDALRVGELVLAVGHPYDFQFTVTTGIVSALGRRNLVEQEIHDFIQTDAAVNPGSSGGPLFNLDGELIGINTAIYSPSADGGGGTGISFAIPSNMAMRVVRELQETGRVAQAGIGVATRDVPATSQSPRPGAEVTRLVPDGPAEKAGLRRGDVIEALDGKPLTSSRDLRAMVLARGAGAEVRLEVRRAGKHLELLMTAVDDRTLGTADMALPDGAFEWGGLTLAAASPELLAERGVALPADAEGGLVVLAAEPGGPAAQAGIAPGDVILEVGKKPVLHAAAFLEAVDGRKSAMVRFWRGEGYAYAAVGGLREASD